MRGPYLCFLFVDFIWGLYRGFVCVVLICTLEFDLTVVILLFFRVFSGREREIEEVMDDDEGQMRDDEGVD